MEDKEKNNLYIVQSRKYDARDVPGHLNVKTRKDFQRDYVKPVKKRIIGRLDIADDEFVVDKGKPRNLKQRVDMEQRVADLNNNSDDEDNTELIHQGKRKKIVLNTNLKEKEESDSDESEEEDPEVLMKEYERIKKVRETEEKIIEKQRIAQEMEARSSNNSLFSENTYSLKKRWFEDTVFSNQNRKRVKAEDKKKEECNDILRSKGHKDFLKRFIHT